MFDSEVTDQEAVPVQKVGFEQATLSPSEWVETCRLRCALHTGNGPRSAVTGMVSHLANHLAASTVFHSVLPSGIGSRQRWSAAVLV